MLIKNIDTKGFRERLEIVIQKLGMNYKEFCEGMEMNQPTLSDILHGKHKPRYEFFFKLVHAYPVRLEYLLKGEGKPFSEPGQSIELDKPYSVETRRVARAMEISPLIRHSILAALEQVLLNNSQNMPEVVKELDDIMNSSDAERDKKKKSRRKSRQ